MSLACRNHRTWENWLAPCISNALPRDVRQSTNSLLQAWELLSMFYLNKTILQAPITSRVDTPVSDFQCLQSLWQLKWILSVNNALKKDVVQQRDL